MTTLAPTTDMRALLPTADLTRAAIIVRAEHAKSRAIEWNDENGRRIRSAFWIRLDLCRKGRFTIILAVDATQTDLEAARALLQKIKHGKFRQTHQWKLLASGALDLLVTGRAIRAVEPDAPVIPCSEPRCTEHWHVASDSHTAESIYREVSNGGYTIEVRKELDVEDGPDWYIDVFTDEFYGSPEDTASFISDLAWAQEECRRANAHTAIQAVAA